MIGSGYERRDYGSEPAGTAVSAAKIRVYKLAEELGLAPKDLVTKLRTLGVEVGNHMANLEGADADRVRRAIERERQESLVEERLSDTVIRRRSRVPSERVVVDPTPVAGDPVVPAEGERSRAEQWAGETHSAEWIELQGEGAGAALVKYDQSESAKILDYFKKLDLEGGTPGHTGSLGSIVVDQLASASSVVAAGLQASQVFQVIGTPQLVEGLKAGTYALMQTAQGTLGTVVSSTSSRIVGQLRFAQASLAPVMAPVLAWQLLHAIAGTTQLRKINKRLDVMQRKLENMQVRQEAEVIGEVRWAVRTLEDILDERANTGTFTQDMLIRLAQVEKSIGCTLGRNRALMDQFHAMAKSVRGVRGKSGAVRGTALLQEEGRQAVRDLELLVGLAAADLRVEEARLYAGMEHSQTDVQRRLKAVTEKVDDYQQMLSHLPSVEGITDHVKRCVDEMGWWQRRVFSRGVVKEVTAVARAGLRDVSVPGLHESSSGAPGYVFWRDDKGVMHVRMLPGEQDDD